MVYNRYFGLTDYSHDTVARTGVLLVNLGTPDAPTAAKLKPYLKEFLCDPRVIEVRPWLWWLILNCFILPLRPRRSAVLYQNVWTSEGSPLLLYTQAQSAKLSSRVAQEFGDRVIVDFAMAVGNPSIDSKLKSLASRGVRQLLVLPLFPQYSGTTTGSVFDKVTSSLQKFRWLPDFRFATSYHDHPAYIDGIVRSIKKSWQNGRTEKLVFSFHGIPERYFKQGDPYYCYCHKTARLVAEQLSLSKDDYILCFQSRFGKEKWLTPYTDETLTSLAAKGVKSVSVICPAFLSDCLETIDEIGRESRHVFLKAGGEEFCYVPCLNDSSDCIDLLYSVVSSNLKGWAEQQTIAN